MKKFVWMVALMFVAGLFASTAMAAGNGNGPVNNQGNGNDQVKNGKSNVPQAQIDMIKKREKLRKQHDKMLKVRQRLIETDDPGNVDGQHPVN